jgi:hypothetical protein
MIISSECKDNLVKRCLIKKQYLQQFLLLNSAVGLRREVRQGEIYYVHSIIMKMQKYWNVNAGNNSKTFKIIIEKFS